MGSKWFRICRCFRKKNRVNSRNDRSSVKASTVRSKVSFHPDVDRREIIKQSIRDYPSLGSRLHFSIECDIREGPISHKDNIDAVSGMGYSDLMKDLQLETETIYQTVRIVERSTTNFESTHNSVPRRQAQPSRTDLDESKLQNPYTAKETTTSISPSGHMPTQGSVYQKNLGGVSYAPQEDQHEKDQDDGSSSQSSHTSQTMQKPLAVSAQKGNSPVVRTKLRKATAKMSIFSQLFSLFKPKKSEPELPPHFKKFETTKAESSKKSILSNPNDSKINDRPAGVLKYPIKKTTTALVKPTTSIENLVN